MKRTTICVIPANSEGFTKIFLQLDLVVQREWIHAAETEKGEKLLQSRVRGEIYPESYENNDTRKRTDRKNEGVREGENREEKQERLLRDREETDGG